MTTNRYLPLTQNEFIDNFDQDSEDYVSPTSKKKMTTIKY